MTRLLRRWVTADLGVFFFLSSQCGRRLTSPSRHEECPHFLLVNAIQVNQHRGEALIVIIGKKLSRVRGQQAFLFLGGTPNSQDIESWFPWAFRMNTLMVGPGELLTPHIEPQCRSSGPILALRQGEGDSPHCLAIHHK